MTRRKTYSEEEITFIKENVHLGDKKLSEILKRSESAIKTIRQRLGIITRPRTKYTELHHRYLRRYYECAPIFVLAEKIGFTENSVFNYASRVGLKKTEQQKKESWKYARNSIITNPDHPGRKHQFKKGQVSHNKGKKMDPELKERIKHTFFQKGHLPTQTLYDGAITIRYDHPDRSKTNKAYKWIRISKAVWEPLHRYNWKQKHGEIPKKSVVAFKPGFNPLDLELNQTDCLELITMRENANRNRLSQWPEELREVIVLSNKITQQLKQNVKQRKLK